MTSPATTDRSSHLDQRRLQILEAGMRCFARKGIRPTTMQDISQEADISVGLIYRYFESKEQVIATMASEHLAELQRKVEIARGIPHLFDALQTVLRCEQHEPHVAASFLLDLFAESAHNPHVREHLVRVQVCVTHCVADLIATSPEAAGLSPGISPRQAAEMIFHSLHGLMFVEVLQAGTSAPAELIQQRTETLQRLWTLLFPALPASAAGARNENHGS